MRSGTENVPGIAGMAKAVEQILLKLKRIVESRYCFSTPIAFNVADIAGLFDEQALPAETYIPLSSNA